MERLYGTQWTYFQRIPLCDKYIRKHFIDNISLDEIEVSVTYCTYGNSGEARDATEEKCLLSVQALSLTKKEEPGDSVYDSARGRAVARLCQELTERGMSRFLARRRTG